MARTSTSSSTAAPSDDDGRAGRRLRGPQVLRLRLGRGGPEAAGPARGGAGQVDLAYQNLESSSSGVTTVDHYFDTLGGIARAVKRARGRARGETCRSISAIRRGATAKVRTLKDQVALETRSRALNPPVLRAAADPRARGRARKIESARHQHDGLVGDHRRGRALGLPAHLRDLRAGRGDARTARRSEPCRRPSRMANRLLEASDRAYWQPRRRDAGGVCRSRPTPSRIGWKAWRECSRLRSAE